MHMDKLKGVLLKCQMQVHFEAKLMTVAMLCSHSNTQWVVISVDDAHRPQFNRMYAFVSPFTNCASSTDVSKSEIKLSVYCLKMFAIEM